MGGMYDALFILGMYMAGSAGAFNLRSMYLQYGFDLVKSNDSLLDRQVSIETKRQKHKEKLKKHVDRNFGERNRMKKPSLGSWLLCNRYYKVYRQWGEIAERKLTRELDIIKTLDRLRSSSVANMILMDGFQQMFTQKLARMTITKDSMCSSSSESDFEAAVWDTTTKTPGYFHHMIENNEKSEVTKRLINLYK
jgi:hypothetical protein